MNNQTLTAIMIGFGLCLNISPAMANEINGANGGSVTNQRRLQPNSEGGYTGGSQQGFTTPEGAGRNRQRSVNTDGNGNADYQGSQTIKTPGGDTVESTTEGSSSYNREDGYSGNNTTTVNEKTLETTTEDGSTSVTNSEGDTQTFTRPRSRK